MNGEGSLARDNPARAGADSSGRVPQTPGIWSGAVSCALIVSSVVVCKIVVVVVAIETPLLETPGALELKIEAKRGAEWVLQTHKFKRAHSRLLALYLPEFAGV